jgi:protein-tyrosine phosphatase
MNILFVCTKNKWRSLTAEHIFKGRPNCSVRSAGTASNARVKISSTIITWADLIFVMERKHLEILARVFPSQIKNKKIICLDIPDEYEYMDEELVQILEESVSEYLET